MHFVTHFRPYLVGWHFVLRTDHASLIWLVHFKQSDPMYCNWIMKLEQYDYEIRHRAGTKHANACLASPNERMQGGTVDVHSARIVSRGASE